MLKKSITLTLLVSLCSVNHSHPLPSSHDMAGAARKSVQIIATVGTFAYRYLPTGADNKTFSARIHR
jgi:hypothetical protein